MYIICIYIYIYTYSLQYSLTRRVLTNHTFPKSMLESASAWFLGILDPQLSGPEVFSCKDSCTCVGSICSFCCSTTLRNY